MPMYLHGALRVNRKEIAPVKSNQYTAIKNYLMAIQSGRFR